MATVFIAENKQKASELLVNMLAKEGNRSLYIIKQEGVIKIMEKEDLKSMVCLEDKISELEGSLYNEKKGVLYKSILEAVEKPLIERVLMRTEGNQLKAAKILGVNRNTFRTKVKRLGINPNVYKHKFQITIHKLQTIYNTEITIPKL